MSCASLNTQNVSQIYNRSIPISNKYPEQYKTILPKQRRLDDLKIICEPENDTNYTLFLHSPAFDPNIENSPPNLFMQNLQERMNNYYSRK